jgi:hypothetical protein
VDGWAQQDVMELFLEQGERGEERATGPPEKNKEEEESERSSESAAKRRRPDSSATAGEAAAKKSKTGAGKSNNKAPSSGSDSAARGAAAAVAVRVDKGTVASKGKTGGASRGKKSLTPRAASGRAAKAAKRSAGASARSGTGAAADVADEDGDAVQQFTAAPVSFAKESAALEGADEIIRAAELAAGSNPAALKAALAMSRALVQGLDRVVRMGAEVVTALTTASESSLGATPTKSSGGRGSRNMLYAVSAKLDELAVEMSPFPDVWEENGKTGVAIVVHEGDGRRTVTEKQVLGHVSKLRSSAATAVQNFVARQIGTTFPDYKERSDPTSERTCRVL